MAVCFCTWKVSVRDPDLATCTNRQSLQHFLYWSRACLGKKIRLLVQNFIAKRRSRTVEIARGGVSAVDRCNGTSRLQDVAIASARGHHDGGIRLVHLRAQEKRKLC